MRRVRQALLVCGAATALAAAPSTVTLALVGQPLQALSSQAVSGGQHQCIVTGGAVICSGINDYGQTNVPAGLPTIAEVCTGMRYSCARGTDLSLTCFGDLPNDGYNLPTTLANVKDMACGYDFLIVLDATTGFPTGYGYNDYGTLLVPAADLASVAAGWQHACGTYAANGRRVAMRGCTRQAIVMVW